MRRLLFAIVIAAIAAGAWFFESTPPGLPVRTVFEEWLAANALPAQPERVAVVELASDLRALDAALILRAVLRYEPRAVAFLDPIAPGEGESLLASKLGDARMPVVFTSDKDLESLPRVLISDALPPPQAAPGFVPEGKPAGGAHETARTKVSTVLRQGGHAVASAAWRLGMALDGVSPAEVSGEVPGLLRAGSMRAPVDVEGETIINSLAARYVNRIAFDQLMVRTERSEQGSIGLDLETMFRGRIVAVQKIGEDPALGLAALRNRLVQSSPPLGLVIAGILLAATLPWWHASRRRRALLAFGASCGWVLLALALYQEFGMTAPLSTMVLLPLLALIPPPSRSSNKVE